MTIILRPDQQALKQAVYDEWNAGHSNVLAVSATGSGKTVITTDVMLDGHNQGLTELVMAHRNELVGQMSRAVAMRGIPHRIIGSSSTIAGIVQEHRAEFGRSFINPDARCTVASVQTIASRTDTLKQWAAQVDRWTLDECFPAGTMISTPEGERPIESIRVGDIVTAWDERGNRFVDRRVNHLFRNPTPENMVRIDSGEHHVVATINHPFWTARGWVAAGDLETTDDILVDMCSMRAGVHNRKRTHQLSSKKTRSGILYPEVRICTSGQGAFRGAEATTCQGKKADKTTEGAQDQTRAGTKDLSGVQQATRSTTRENLLERVHGSHHVANNGSDEPSIRIATNDRSQSDETGRCSCKSVRLIKSDEPQTTSTRWQRQGSTESGASVDEHVDTVRLRPSICNTYGNETRDGLSDMLQTGCSTSDIENSSGSGREITRIVGTAGTRLEERHVFKMQRVDRVEVYQRTDSERSVESHVYNFEVDQLHTYVANGIVVHNCHHAIGNDHTEPNLWGRVIKMFPNARGLGVTACPQRADGKGLGSHHDGPFDAMVIGIPMRQLIDLRALSDFEFSIPQSDFEIAEDAITGGGDYSPTKMRDASKRSHIIGDVVVEYSARAMGRRAICFATDVDTANNIANRFNEAGIPAASVSAKTDTGVRRDMIRRFRDGRILVLVNVDLFDEGFDVPACDVVIMARPTASLNKYLQMCGRSMRRDPANPSKVALIIDHVSNFKRHLMPDRPRAWTLDRRDKRAKQEPDPDDIPLTACRSCSRPYERCLPRCPYCGAEPPLPAAGSRTPERVDGDLVLLDRATLDRMRAAMTLEAPADVAERVKHAAGPVAAAGAANRAMERHQAQAALRGAIEQFAGIRRYRGDEDRSIHKRFYLTTGMTVLDALALPRAEMDVIKAMVESWYR